MTVIAEGPRELSAAAPEDSSYDADVIVIGAGPSGSAAAYWMATAGLDVLLLEKTSFPREKVCGDGLTPRGTRALVEMGIDVSEEAGWLHNKGLRVIGGGLRLELDWPELASFPPYGLVRPRADLDHLLVRQAVKAGARLHEQTAVTGPVTDRQGRVVGVSARAGADPADRRELTYRAPVVLACDGVSGRFALALGLQRNDKRPMGVAVRRYYTSPRTDDDYLESWLELWDGPPGADDAKLLPGYGWIFGMGDGSVNVGPGSAELLGRLPEDQLPHAADRAGWTTPRPSGACARRTRCAPPRAPACRWASTGPRTTATGCCWWATPAAR